jgi:hypothetical protein
MNYRLMCIYPNEGIFSIKFKDSGVDLRVYLNAGMLPANVLNAVPSGVNREPLFKTSCLKISVG